MKKIPTNYVHVVASTSSADVVSVAEIARDLHMNPKHVRARMRKLYKMNDVRIRTLETIAKGVWKYNVADAADVRALIASFANDGETESNGTPE